MCKVHYDSTDILLLHMYNIRLRYSFIYRIFFVLFFSLFFRFLAFRKKMEANRHDEHVREQRVRFHRHQVALNWHHLHRIQRNRHRTTGQWWNSISLLLTNQIFFFKIIYSIVRYQCSLQVLFPPWISCSDSLWLSKYRHFVVWF